MYTVHCMPIDSLKSYSDSLTFKSCLEHCNGYLDNISYNVIQYYFFSSHSTSMLATIGY